MSENPTEVPAGTHNPKAAPPPPAPHTAPHHYFAIL